MAGPPASLRFLVLLVFAPLTPVLLAMPLLSPPVVVALTAVWLLVPSWGGWIFVGTSLGLMQWRVWKLYVQRLAMSVYVYSFCGLIITKYMIIKMKNQRHEKRADAAPGYGCRRTRLGLSENHPEHIENWRAHLKHERFRCNRSFASLS
jgi:hypothetical protein